MTTPPPPAGWYPDPDGSGGQRYWDATGWTEHQAPPPEPPAPEPAPEPSAAPAAESSTWPPELPPWPTDMEMPSWEAAATEVVQLPTDAPETATEPAAPTEPETPAEDSEPVPPTEAPTAVVSFSELPTTVVPIFGFPPPPRDPVAFTAPSPASGGNLLKGYIGAVAVLLVALIAVLVYALVIHKPPTTRNGMPGASSSTVKSTVESTKHSTSATKSSATVPTPAEPGAVADGDVTFAPKGIDIAPNVASPDNVKLTKTAQGEFIVVHLTLANNGSSPATYIAEMQKLTAGGQTYTPDTEATFYIGGTTTVVYPGEPVDVSIAFDVPAGTVPESLAVHGDLHSAGAVLPLP